MKKKLFFIVAVMTGVLFSACQNSKIKEIPLTSTLTSYTIEDDSLGLLTGVKEIKTQKILIAPGKYTDIHADQNVITLKNDKNQTVVYLPNGEKLGSYEMFTHWTYNGDYYLGVNYDKSSYYFPKTKTLLRPTTAYLAADVMILELKGLWNVVSYNGEIILNAPPKIWVLNNAKDKKTEELSIVFKTDAAKKPYVVYNTQGKQLKQLSQKEFERLKSSFISQKPLGSESVYAEYVAR